MLAGMSSCYHEDALIVPDQPDKYNILTDDPSDPTQHFYIPVLSEISDCDYNQSD